MNKLLPKSFHCNEYKNCPVTPLLFKTLKNNEDLGIVIYRSNKFLYVNQIIMDITEYNRTELLNRNFLNFIHPIDRNFLEDVNRKRLKGENIPNKYKIHIVKKSGKVGLIEINVENPPIHINKEKLILAKVREIDRSIFAFKRPK